MRGLHPYRMERPSMAQFRYDEIAATRSRVQSPRPYIRGRGFGGSSTVNGHLAIRGTLPDDFDSWGDDCAGWSGADVLPAFIRLENDLDFPDAPYHGSSGPLPISRAPEREWTKFDHAFRDAALSQGHPWSVDHNSPDSTGVSPFASILSGGERVSANRAYLEPARVRQNLTVLGGAAVSTIVFEGDRAVGVRASVEGRDATYHADEVLLCAGAVHSPAILLRSGVGPADELREHNISVVVDAPVGENLQDHSSVWLGVVLDEGNRAMAEPRFANCCVRYTSGLGGAGRNDMFMSTVNATVVPENPYDAIVNVSTFQAFSRGRLTLRTADPSQEPILAMSLLSDERDRLRLRDGARRLWDLLTQIQQELNVVAIAVPHTGETVRDLPSSDAELDQWLLTVCSDAAHIAGTCRMGHPDDAGTVVKPDCSVVGTSGLRVIDASIMPEIVRANTQLPTVMIAEHAARLLISQRRLARASR